MIVNPNGKRRVVVTRELPGRRWRELLAAADCRIEIGGGATPDERGLMAMIGGRCDGAIGQLTEPWTAAVLAAFVAAGGSAFSTYAVGHDNVDVAAATRLGLPVGTTPGVLTEATAEMAVALTFAAARRIPEGDRLVRAGQFQGWRPDLLLGELLWRKTLGVIGPGRIGAAYARMMIEGHKMDVVYYSRRVHDDLERFVAEYNAFLAGRGEKPIACRRAPTLEDLLASADVVSLHTSLSNATHHLIAARELAAMKPTSVLVNTSRGQAIDEAALVEHCRAHPGFRAGLDVYESEPALSQGLAELDNVVLSPHVGSATRWTRQGMATLAAANVAALLNSWPVWPRAATIADVAPFLHGTAPEAAPNIVNAAALGLRRLPSA